MRENELTPLEQNLIAFKENNAKEAEQRVLREFPRRVIELEKLLQTKFSSDNIKNYIPNLADQLNRKEQGHFNALSGTTVFPDTNGTGSLSGTASVILHEVASIAPPSNQFIVELIGIVKSKIYLLCDDADKVKMWIELLIPKVEDGNNFGVSVQQDAIKLITNYKHKSTSYYYLKDPSDYYSTRATVEKLIARNPHVESYKKRLLEIDEKQFQTLRMTVNNIRNFYVVMHDFITKNLEKIKNPRTVNTAHMYC